MSDYATFLAEAREHLDRLDGTLLPEFTQVPDGYYTQCIVLDEEVVAEVVEASAVPSSVAWHHEPCRIPRYRTEVRWRPA